MSTINRKIQESIMGDIMIESPNKVYFQYMINDPYYMRFIDDRNGYDNEKRQRFFQFGGGNVKKLKYKYDNKVFIYQASASGLISSESVGE